MRIYKVIQITKIEKKSKQCFICDTPRKSVKSDSEKMEMGLQPQNSVWAEAGIIGFGSFQLATLYLLQQCTEKNGFLMLSIQP